VQIVHSSRRGARDIEHVGSAVDVVASSGLLEMTAVDAPGAAQG
jgi:hypothetical protein